MTISIKEASKITNRSQKTIRRHIHAETLLSEKISGAYRIKKTDLELWNSNFNKNNIRIKTSVTLSTDNNITPNDFKEIDIKALFEKDSWNKVNKNGPTFADFFAGAGGLTTGLVMAGFRPVHSVEIMPQAVRTYNANIGKRFNEDILDTRDITSAKVKMEAITKLKDANVDVIIGGFPCQGFSMSGSRVVDDPRNSLYMHMLEVVKAVQPKVVIMENVTGLRSMMDGNVEKKIIEDYQKAGYNISVKTLNSADYKVPQQRKRVIFIANKIGQVNLYPKPILTSDKYISVKDAIGDLVKSKENIDTNHEFTKHRADMLPRLKAIPEGKSLYKGYSDAWKKVYWDKPSPTVKENHGGVFVHPKLARVMTPRELARLQSFPDDFIFMGPKKWQLVQIGNAVPPLMAKAIALSVKKMISKS